MVSDPFIAPGMNSLLWSKPQNQSREQLLTSTNNIATINLVGVSYLAGHCYSMKGPALGESVDVSLSHQHAYLLPAVGNLARSRCFLVKD